MTFSSPKAAEVVARTILEDICAKGLEKGDPLLLEAAMIDEYQAGRASVREALRMLEQQGLISLRPGRSGGAFVRTADADHLGRTLTLFLQMLGATYNDVVMCMQVFGPKIAELAALNPDREAVIRKLGLALETDRCNYTVSVDVDPEQLLDFHHALNSLCGNPVLGLLMDTVESIIINHVIHLTPPEDRMPWFHADHEHVAAAIIDGDSALAHTLYTEHLRVAAEYYRERNHAKFTATVQWQ